jgi:hypothetical protein
MDMLQVRFNHFFEAILKDLRTCLQKRNQPVGYSEEFGEDIIRHMRPLPGELKGIDDN